MQTFGKWLIVNCAMVIGFALVSPILGLLGPVPAALAWPIGMFVAFPVAAWILLDFARRGSGETIIDEKGGLHLGPSFAAATRHTFWHAAWPHGLNVAYSLGYTCLFFAFGKSHPHVMGVWLACVLILTILKDPKTRSQILSWRLWAAVAALGTSLVLLTSMQTKGSVLKSDLDAATLIGANVGLVLLGMIIWFFIRNRRLGAGWTWIVGFGCFLAASAILRDFSLHAANLPMANGRVDLGIAYNRALYHTIAYAAWPHALNVFFSLGFSTLTEKTKSGATAMAAWLVATVTVPLLFHFQEFVSSAQSPIALALMGVAAYLLWKLSTQSSSEAAAV